jgi:hypothetical protein
VLLLLELLRLNPALLPELLQTKDGQELLIRLLGAQPELLAHVLHEQPELLAFALRQMPDLLGDIIKSMGTDSWLEVLRQNPELIWTAMEDEDTLAKLLTDQPHLLASALQQNPAILMGLVGDAGDMDVGEGQQWGQILEKVTQTLQTQDIGEICDEEGDGDGGEGRDSAAGGNGGSAAGGKGGTLSGKLRFKRGVTRLSMLSMLHGKSGPMGLSTGGNVVGKAGGEGGQAMSVTVTCPHCKGRVAVEGSSGKGGEGKKEEAEEKGKQGKQGNGGKESFQTPLHWTRMLQGLKGAKRKV